MALRPLFFLAVFLAATCAESRIMPLNVFGALSSASRLGLPSRPAATTSGTTGALKKNPVFLFRETGLKQSVVAQLNYTCTDQRVSLNVTSADPSELGASFTGSAAWDVSKTVTATLGIAILSFDDAHDLSGKAAFSCHFSQGFVECDFQAANSTAAAKHIANIQALSPLQKPEPGFEGQGTWMPGPAKQARFGKQ